MPGSKDVRGNDSIEKKETTLADFASGALRVLVSKPSVCGFGLNWQHCRRVAFVGRSFSYESWYQAVRRCWRFGQEHPVTVDIIATEGEANVRENMRRKAQAADVMFAQLVTHMHDALTIVRHQTATTPVELPSWVS